MHAAPAVRTPPGATAPAHPAGVFARALKIINHNRYAALAVATVTACSVWLCACQSTTRGLSGPEPVTRAELDRQAIEAAATLATERADIEARLATHNAKVEAHNAAIEAAGADLARQDALKTQIIEAVGGAALRIAAGAIDPASLVTTIVGVGSAALVPALVMDKRRADKRIRALKAPQQEPRT